MALPICQSVETSQPERRQIGDQNTGQPCHPAGNAAFDDGHTACIGLGRMACQSRRLSQSRGVTLFEVGVFGSVLAVAVAAAAIWLGPGTQAERTDEAVRSAVPIRRALQAWQDDNGAACPSVSQLVHEGYLRAGPLPEDPWGNRYRILCDEDKKVVSPGIDGELGTTDDIVLRVEH
jgi:hypothetical protein